MVADLTLKLRSGLPADAYACGEICYEAFTTISEYHRFPTDLPSADIAHKMMVMLFSRPDVFSVVAEVAGQIVGSNFLWEESAIAGVGPLSVAPSIQNVTVGRRLMEAVLERAKQQQFTSVRLVQAAFHNRSLALYTKLGFDVQEPLANLQGTPLGIKLPGYPVRPATFDDLEACNRLCQKIHGFDRGRELHHAIQQGKATVVEHDDATGGRLHQRITGYATVIGFFGHAVCESNEDLKALIGAAQAFEGSGFLVPTRNSQLFRWCLQQGLRVVQPMTLMSAGLYHQPTGVFLPSILF
ncbi:GNAT family N-acetyltransferase [Stenomitos frigidus ULC18]|uniref:GNAT family N-acetyltransferase n=2 Tax=Stenomitos TaxID=1844270 RepID=A0A2T1E175_9CYAN|nr:GNAT family N-acetyltransferase [Stenomitos frigidus ULC18]